MAARTGASDLSAEARSAKVEGCAASARSAPSRSELTTTPAVSAEQLASARSETAHIFRRAGISLEWIECRVPGSEGAPCTEPLLAGRDLMLRLVDRTPAQGERIVALGESMLDREQRGGVLMTIDVLPVRAIAGRAATAIADVARPGNCARDWTFAVGQPRAPAVGPDAGDVVAGRASRPQTGLLGRSPHASPHRCARHCATGSARRINRTRRTERTQRHRWPSGPRTSPSAGGTGL